MNGGPQCDEYQCLLFPIRVDEYVRSKKKKKVDEYVHEIKVDEYIMLQTCG